MKFHTKDEAKILIQKALNERVRIGGKNYKYSDDKTTILVHEQIRDEVGHPLGWQWLQSSETLESLTEAATETEVATTEMLIEYFRNPQTNENE